MASGDNSDNEMPAILKTIPDNPNSLLAKFPNMNLMERQDLTCDEIFGIYLTHASKCANLDYYKTVLKFVLLYRSCLNEYGWERRKDHVLRCGWQLDQDDVYTSILKREGKTLEDQEMDDEDEEENMMEHGEDEQEEHLDEEGEAEMIE